MREKERAMLEGHRNILDPNAGEQRQPEATEKTGSFCRRRRVANYLDCTVKLPMRADIFAGQIIVSNRAKRLIAGGVKVMNKIFVSLICAGALLPIVANAQVSTVGGNESVGKITDYTPDSALVLDTGSGDPVHYKFAKHVTFVDKDGTTIQTPALSKNLRVKVHYVKQGGDMIVDKVTLAE